MLVATFAITGIPFFAGFFSKDAILFAAFQSQRGGIVLYAFGLLTARLPPLHVPALFLTFNGRPRFDEHHVHVHESPWSMLGPLVILAVLSTIGGWFALPAFFSGSGPLCQFPCACFCRA